MFFTFEGLDGSGKSTQIRLLADRLKEMGHQVRVLREPGGTEWSEALRNVLLTQREHEIHPLAESLVFFSARTQLVHQVLKPALLSGETVLLDRYVESSFAYQGYGGGLDLTFLHMLGEHSTGGLRPDKIIYLDISFKDSENRQTIRGQKDRMEMMSEDHFNKIRNGYLEMATTDPDRWLVLPANSPQQEIHEHIFGLFR